MHEDKNLNQLMEQAAAKMNIKVADSKSFVFVDADSYWLCRRIKWVFLEHP